jgi:hypothetical protein
VRPLTNDHGHNTETTNDELVLDEGGQVSDLRIPQTHRVHREPRIHQTRRTRQPVLLINTIRGMDHHIRGANTRGHITEDEHATRELRDSADRVTEPVGVLLSH